MSYSVDGSDLNCNSCCSEVCLGPPPPKLLLKLGMQETLIRKNNWVRNELGNSSFTGGSLASELLTACSRYRAFESNPQTTPKQLDDCKNRMLTAFSVWLFWRVMHASGKAPEDSSIPMEAVDVIFLKVNEKIESQFNIVFELEQ